uniref:Rab-GAP TBC domain-containing protein n=1 Tax=Paramoeba aestuarina TaxID=180227 RepID=A0A7S4NXB6_9EUKA
MENLTARHQPTPQPASSFGMEDFVSDVEGEEGEYILDGVDIASYSGESLGSRRARTSSSSVQLDFYDYFQRAKQWQKLIGNSLGVTLSLFESLLERAGTMESEGASSDRWCGCEQTSQQIMNDIPRTFSSLFQFQDKSEQLMQCLTAWVFMRPDIGYVQGMSNLCGIILMVEGDTFTTFVCLSNLIVNSVILTRLFYMSESDVNILFRMYNQLCKTYVPEALQHLENHNIAPHSYLLDWWITFFSRALPLSTTLHLWDLWLVEGDKFFFQAAVGLLKTLSPRLCSMKEQKMIQNCLLNIKGEGEDWEGQLYENIASIQLSHHYLKTEFAKHGWPPPKTNQQL